MRQYAGHSILGRPQESLAMSSPQSMLLLLQFLFVHCSLTMARISSGKTDGEQEKPRNRNLLLGETNVYQNKNVFPEEVNHVMTKEWLHRNQLKMDHSYDVTRNDKFQDGRLHVMRPDLYIGGQPNKKLIQTSQGLSPAALWRGRRLNQKKNQTEMLSEVRYGIRNNINRSKCQCRNANSDLKRMRNIFNIHDNDCCFSNRILDRAQSFLPGIRRLWNNFPSLTAQLQGSMDLFGASSENEEVSSMENLSLYNTNERSPQYNYAPFNLQLVRPNNNLNQSSSSSPLEELSISSSSDKPTSKKKRSTFLKKLIFKIFDFDFDEKDKKEDDKGYVPLYPVMSLQYQPIPPSYPVSPPVHSYPMMNYPHHPHHPPEKPALKQHFHYHMYQDQQQYKTPQYTQSSYSSEVRPVYQPPSNDFYDRRDSGIGEQGLINNYVGPSVVLHSPTPKISTVGSAAFYPNMASMGSNSHLSSVMSHPHTISSLPHQMSFSPHLTMTSSGPQMMYRIGRSSDPSTKGNHSNNSENLESILHEYVTPHPEDFDERSPLKTDHDNRIKPDETKVSVEVFVTRENEPSSAANRHHIRQKNSIRNEELNPLSTQPKAERKLDERFRKDHLDNHAAIYPGNGQISNVPSSRFLVKPKANESQQDYLLRSHRQAMDTHQMDKIYHYATPDPRTFSAAVENSAQYLGFPRYVFPKRQEYLIRKLVNQSPRHGLRAAVHSAIGSNPQHGELQSSVFKVENDDRSEFQQVRPSSLLHYREGRSQSNHLGLEDGQTIVQTLDLPINIPANQNQRIEQRQESHVLPSNLINHDFASSDRGMERHFQAEGNLNAFHHIPRNENLKIQLQKHQIVTHLTPEFRNFPEQTVTLNGEAKDNNNNLGKDLLLIYSSHNQKNNSQI